MIAATRTLQLRQGAGTTDVRVQIHVPENLGSHWVCNFEIGWPENNQLGHAGGLDAVQALYLAMQMIGIHLYANPAHKAGTLSWGDPGGGYGFPMPKGSGDLLVGKDRRNQL
jgi:hypothetical protein